MTSSFFNSNNCGSTKMLPISFPIGDAQRSGVFVALYVRIRIYTCTSCKCLGRTKAELQNENNKGQRHCKTLQTSKYMYDSTLIEYMFSQRLFFKRGPTKLLCTIARNFHEPDKTVSICEKKLVIFGMREMQTKSFVPL